MVTGNDLRSSVPHNYDRYLGPVLFEPYALDIKNRLSKRTYSRVLELACGTGRLTNHLLELTDPKGTITAIDIDPGMLAVSKDKVKDTRVEWHMQDAQDLSFTDSVFDLVVCQFGVMFFPDKTKAFAEAYRVLKPGGLFVFNIWDELSYNPGSGLMQDILKEILLDDAPDFKVSGPFSFNNKIVIRQMLETAGFEVTEINVVNKIAYYQTM